MQEPIIRPGDPLISRYWRHLFILVIVAGSLAAMFLFVSPFGQEQSYHAFADRRMLLSIPNFGDVASNVGFLIMGLAGLKVCFSKRLGKLHAAWTVMFAGITLVGIASSYYHWDPNDQ